MTFSHPKDHPGPRGNGLRAFGVALALMLWIAGAALAEGRPATLYSTSEGTCWHPHFTDNQVSSEQVELALPEVDGPVKGQGRYELAGTMPGGPYNMSGISALGGKVHGDAELILTYEQWNYGGEWMPSDFPSEAEPVVIPLEPGETVSVTRDTTVDGVRCKSTVVYHIEFERQTQVWDVSLTGSRKLLYLTTYTVIDTETGQSSPLPYEHGFTMAYDLGARATLEKRAGKWQFRDGIITRAKAGFSYAQSPELYEIRGRKCPGCDKVAKLAGQSIHGESDGRILRLSWPGALHPEVVLETAPAFACAPGPEQSSCERKKKDSTNFSDSDDDFFWRAASHVLMLKSGPQSFVPGPGVTTTTRKQIRHIYTLRQVK
jgi:hypothetical protein